MLTEVVCPIKLLCRVAFPQFMNLSDMAQPVSPVLLTGALTRAIPTAASEFLSAIPASIGRTWMVDALLENIPVAPAWYV